MQKDKPVTRHIPTLCDWFSFFFMYGIFLNIPGLAAYFDNSAVYIVLQDFQTTLKLAAQVTQAHVTWKD